MSASTIARWNAITMTRDPDAAQSNKRSRSDDDGDSSDDKVSLVSRSPSPQPERDVEMKDVYGYDEYVRGVAREVITVETKIKNSNKGFTMLAKMGWTEGKPLGLSGDGRVDPIPFSVKQDSTGLGKVTQDFRMIETTVSQRRNLESERMQFETVEQREQREATIAQKAVVQSEISNALRAFYCELCDKQFKTVAQYDEHTNSYAHHHKARARDMNANHPVRAGARDEAERRKEKERKREEKELRKLAKAAGIKLAAPPVANGSPSQAGKEEGKGFKKTGWASVGDALAASTSATAATSRPPPPPPPPPPPSAPAPPPPAAPSHHGFQSGGWSSLSNSTEASSTPNPNRSGWANVPPSSISPPPPRSAPTDAPSPPPPYPLPPMPPFAPSTHMPSSSWSRLPPPDQSSSMSFGARQSGDTRPPPEGNLAHNPPLPPAQTQAQSTSNPSPTPNPKPKAKAKSAFDEAATAQSRGNWQSFQKMRGRR